MKQIPILFLGDAPDAKGGLSRLIRDLAGLLSGNPRYRVGVLGRQAVGSRRLPFPCYSIRNLPGNEWGLWDIRPVWEDFAGHERGVLFTVWDPTRTLWLGQPQFCPDPEVGEWLQRGQFDLWGYFPIDATSPGDRLTGIARDSLMGYRRLLAYTEWSQGLIERSISQPEARKRHLTWLPHGLDAQRWQIQDREAAKAQFFPFLYEGDQLVGVLGSNQPRKDWGMAATVCALLAQRHPRMRFWWHSDLEMRQWNLPALIADLGLAGKVQITISLTDERLAGLYNACDLTLHPGLGEGFGYPIFESLLCGTPVLHGDYAGGASVLRQCQWEDFLVEPEGWRLEGQFNQLRPNFQPMDWVNRAEIIIGEDYSPEALRNSVAHLTWQSLWPSVWEPWWNEAAEGWGK